MAKRKRKGRKNLQSTSEQNIDQSKEQKKKGGIIQNRYFWILIIIPTGILAYFRFTSGDYIFAAIFGFFAVISWFQFLKINAQRQSDQRDGGVFVQEQHSDDTVREEVNIRPLRRG